MTMSDMSILVLENLEDVATYFHTELSKEKKPKKNLLIFAYNGTGKTRISMEFKDIGKDTGKKDTLYFNAYTEDLFTWNNDIKEDKNRYLKMNRDSRFFDALDQFDMEPQIETYLLKYADFNFRFDENKTIVRFNKEVIEEGVSNNVENIKISRGEEIIFIWCFFLTILQLAMDKEIDLYPDIKYIYIDDPISSLDDNNAVKLAVDLGEILKEPKKTEEERSKEKEQIEKETKEEKEIRLEEEKKKIEEELKVVISTHHSLFFNVLHNEFKGEKRTQSYFLSRMDNEEKFQLKITGDTPFFQQVAVINELIMISKTDEVHVHHFAMLRSILERTCAFFGLKSNSFLDCLDIADNDRGFYTRTINLYSHGNHSLYIPNSVKNEDKRVFKEVIRAYKTKFPIKEFEPISTATSC